MSVRARTAGHLHVPGVTPQSPFAVAGAQSAFLALLARGPAQDWMAGDLTPSHSDWRPRLAVVSIAFVSIAFSALRVNRCSLQLLGLHVALQTEQVVVQPRQQVSVEDITTQGTDRSAEEKHRFSLPQCCSLLMELGQNGD